MNAQETEMTCEKCGARVYKEDGDYSCECTAIAIYLVRDMGWDFPKSWKEDGDDEVAK